MRWGDRYALVVVPLKQLKGLGYDVCQPTADGAKKWVSGVSGRPDDIADQVEVDRNFHRIIGRGAMALLTCTFWVGQPSADRPRGCRNSVSKVFMFAREISLLVHASGASCQ